MHLCPNLKSLEERQQRQEKKVDGKKKEYKKILQHLQADLEIAHEQRKNMDPFAVKKRLEDYEKML